MSLELPPPVWSGVFLFFLSLRGAEQLFFCCDIRPSSEVGNYRRHGIWGQLFEILRYLIEVSPCCLAEWIICGEAKWVDHVSATFD